MKPKIWIVTFIFLTILTTGLAESKMHGQDIPMDADDLTDSHNPFLGNSTQVPEDVVDLTDSNDTVTVNGDFSYSRKIPSRSREILSLLSNHQDVDLIIRYKKGASFEEKGLIEKKLGRIGVAKARGKNSDISSFVDDPSVESVEVDQPMTLSSDSLPWNVNLTNAPIAWNLTKGSGVSIAILDSGIALHPDLQIAGGTSVISDNYSDTHGHGTAVAGVLSAIINDEGLVGVAPEANIYAVKITDGPTGMISDALAGLDWAISNNMSLVSMSFGFNEYSPAFASAVQQAYTNGALLVAAAGNENGEIDFPARYDLVIAVGSVDSNLERASSSNYGPELDLMAPGDEINTTSLNSGYSILSGTSLAVPHVAGIAALIKSANQTLTNTQIRNILRNVGQDLGEPGKDDYHGYGLVQYSTFLNLTVVEELPTYYTIYNLSYSNDSQQLAYWKSGNGSYQQENFTIGLFLINITRGNRTGVEIINVTNNGTIQLKTPYIYFDDNFTVDSSTAIDGKSFVNDRLQTELFNSDIETDAYCFDFTNDDVFDKCGYYSSDELTSCIDYAYTLSGDLKAFYDVCEGYPSNCIEDPDFNTLWDLTTTSKTYHNAQMVSYNDCDNSADEQDWNQDMEWYYVFDQRRAICTGNTTYKMDGQYSTGAWNTYKSTLNCGSGTTCDYSVDNEVTTTNRSTAINPCRLNQGQSCTATDQCLNGLNCTNSQCTNQTGQSSSPSDAKCTGNISIVIDNKPIQNNISAMPIYVNGLINGTTNSDGQFNIFYKNNTCSAGINVTAFCLNTTTPCGNTTIRFDSSNFTSRTFDCRVCTFNKDIVISNLAAFQATHPNETNASFTLLIGSLNTSTLNALLFQNDLKTSANLNTFSIGLSNIQSNASFNTSILIPRNDSKLRLMIDPMNSIAESDETNNQLEIISLASKVSIYLNISTGNKMVDAAIDERMRSLFPVKLENESDIVIAIGHPRYNTYTAAFNPITLSLNPAWGVKNQLPFADGADNIQGVIGRLSGANKTKIFIIADFFGGPESIIAATRILIANRTQFTTSMINSQLRPVTFDRTNEIYQTTVDEMTSIPKNRERELPSFKDLTTKILSEQAYDETVYHVYSGYYDVNLRVRRLEPITSTAFSNASARDKPVILARGIFSTLDDWRPLGEKLANSGFDSWLIEITGGPQQDCPACRDYTVSEMAQYFVPSLINGVRNLSNKDQVKYVGYSNGCNAALLSLQNGSISGTKFDTFVGVACPGNFSLNTTGRGLLWRSDAPVMIYSTLLGINHISIPVLAKAITAPFAILSTFPLGIGLSNTNLVNDLALDFGGPYAISKNLFFDYVSRAESETDTQPGVGVVISNTFFIAGKSSEDSNGDMVVPIQDMIGICNNVASNQTKIFSIIPGDHFPLGNGPSLPDIEPTQTAIQQFLKDRTVYRVRSGVNCSVQ